MSKYDEVFRQIKYSLTASMFVSMLMEVQNKYE